MRSASLRRTTRKMNLLANENILAPELKVAQVEKDSGCYDPLSVNYSVSQSNSTSSRFPSVCSSATSPNTTASSAYASATSSCSDSSRLRSEASPGLSVNRTGSCRVPYHPKVSTNALSNESRKTSSLAVPSTFSRSQLRSREGSATSMKSETEDSRFLHNTKCSKIYEKKRLLGKGGFARVYEVFEVDQDGNILSEDSFAAKIINKNRISRPQQREKVDIEVELMKETRGHPNVVNLLDHFEDENCVCILLELCRKKSLAQYLRRKQYLSEPEVYHIMHQVVSGLAHLHNKGIIHRDLKLGNILLTENMQAKIGDFGLAARTEWGKKNTICGTPNFIAPEVLQRQGHGTEADVWALGCLLYTMLVGKPPFETASLRETYRCILKNSYRIPSTVSSEAAELICWMLHPKPKSRPSLSEIASHSFFKKHEQSLQKSRTLSSFSSIRECRKSSDAFVFKPSEQVKATLETECTEASSNLEVSTTSRRSVKKFASRLLKKFNKNASSSKKIESSLKEQNNQRDTTSSTPIAPKTWVNKWVDYSNRYGFGYQLSNGRICVLFNDGKHIALLPCGKIVEYVSSETAKPITFASDAVPPCMTKYASILLNFTSYMDKNLRPSQDMSTRQKNKESVRLLTWCRTDEYVAMYFNDGTMQVNFTHDHVKVNINSLHQSSIQVTFVTPQRGFEIFNCETFPTQATSEMKEKVEMVHQQFHAFFKEENCSSHAFCNMCRQF